MSKTNERFVMPQRSFGRRLSDVAFQAFLVLTFPVVVVLIVLGGVCSWFLEEVL